MTEFGEEIVKIAEAYIASKKDAQLHENDPKKWRRTLGLPTGRLQLGPTPEEAFQQVKKKKLKFTQKTQTLARKIINKVNSDTAAKSKNELIDTEEKELIVMLMMQRIIFNIEHGRYTDRVKGNEYKNFANQLKNIRGKLSDAKNASYLNNGQEIPQALDSIILYFESNQKRRDGKTNFLAKDVAIRIFYAWKLIGYKPSIYYFTNNKERLPKTGYSAFIKATSETIKNYLKKEASKDGSDSALEFTHLRGLDRTLKDFDIDLDKAAPLLIKDN